MNSSVSVDAEVQVPRIKPSRFVHVVYRTHRFDEMIAWYQKVLGAKIQHYDPVIAFVTYDDEHHPVAFLNLSIIEPDGMKNERIKNVLMMRLRTSAAPTTERTSMKKATKTFF